MPYGHEQLAPLSAGGPQGSSLPWRRPQSERWTPGPNAYELQAPREVNARGTTPAELATGSEQNGQRRHERARDFWVNPALGKSGGSSSWLMRWTISTTDRESPRRPPPRFPKSSHPAATGASAPVAAPPTRATARVRCKLPRIGPPASTSATPANRGIAGQPMWPVTALHRHPHEDAHLRRFARLSQIRWRDLPLSSRAYAAGAARDGCLCPVAVALSGGQSIYVVARLVTEQQRDRRPCYHARSRLEAEVDSCSAGSERKRRAYSAAGS